MSKRKNVSPMYRVQFEPATGLARQLPPPQLVFVFSPVFLGGFGRDWALGAAIWLGAPGSGAGSGCNPAQVP
jgi:hypothetical protein